MSQQLSDGVCLSCFCYQGRTEVAKGYVGEETRPVCSSTLRPYSGVCTKGMEENKPIITTTRPKKVKSRVGSMEKQITIDEYVEFLNQEEDIW